jgi:hypothetical protein
MMDSVTAGKEVSIHAMAKEAKNPGLFVRKDKAGKLLDNRCERTEKRVFMVGVAHLEVTINAIKSATIPEVKIYREIWPATTAYSALIFLDSLYVKAAIKASPTPAGSSTYHLPVDREAPIPFMMPTIIPTGQGHNTAAKTTGVEPKFGFPINKGMNSFVKIIARMLKITEYMIIFFIKSPSPQTTRFS